MKWLQNELNSISHVCRNSRPSIGLERVYKVSGIINEVRHELVNLRSICNTNLSSTIVKGEFLEGLKTILAKQTDHLQVKLKEEITERRRLHNQLVEMRGNVRVFCRIRPCDGASTIESFDDETLVLVNEERVRRQFKLDHVFGPDTSNNDVFRELSQLIISSMDGYNISILAYGATNSGKTYTMEGIYERVGIEIFDARNTRHSWQYKFSVCVCEVYMEGVVDLLDLRNLNVDVRINPKTGMFYVPGLKRVEIDSPKRLAEIVASAKNVRSVSSTNCNEQSSRSHLITCIGIDIVTPNGRHIESRIHLVDLAGSERLNKSGASGHVAKEGVAINKSLSALGDVMNARANKSEHVPYRNSTLTSVLQESLGGESKTLVIVQLSPSMVRIQLLHALSIELGLI